jgi:hypothetical protein
MGDEEDDGLMLNFTADDGSAGGDEQAPTAKEKKKRMPFYEAKKLRIAAKVGFSNSAQQFSLLASDLTPQSTMRFHSRRSVFRYLATAATARRKGIRSTDDGFQGRK